MSEEHILSSPFPRPGRSHSTRRAADVLNETTERQAGVFLGMSKELGVPVAWMFLMVVVFCCGAGSYFYWIVIPDHKQSLEDRRAQNRTNESLAESFRILSTQDAVQTSKLDAVKGEISVLNSKTDVSHENQRAAEQVLRDIRNELRVRNSKSND